MAGFALATYRFRGSTAVLFAFVAGNFVPIQILMIPVRDMALKVGLFNTVWALVIFHVSFQTGFCTLFLRNFIKQLPFELIEAARVEGASEWTIYARIVLPLIRPRSAALGILVFTFVWNDYFWAHVSHARGRGRADYRRRGPRSRGSGRPPGISWRRAPCWRHCRRC